MKTDLTNPNVSGFSLSRMRLVSFLLIISMGVINTGCPSSSCKKGSVDMEAPTYSLNQTFTVPNVTFYSDGMGLFASVTNLTTAAGGSYFNSVTIENGAAIPFGAGQVARINNVLLNFDLKQNTVYGQFDYLDQGGTINLGVQNRGSMYIGSMYTMPTVQVINGATITKTNVVDIRNAQGVKTGEKGTIVLTSQTDMGGMMIGGQELFLDNFCFN